MMLFADYIHDKLTRNVDLARLKNGDVIYVKADFILNFFRSVFPKIKTKFILITHNSDYPAKLKFIKYLNHPKMIAWFAENPAFVHPKLIPTPIGIENTNWTPSKTPFIRSVNKSALIPWSERKYLLYINFAAKTNRKKRQPLLDHFSQFDSVFVHKSKVSFDTYMGYIENSKFVLCPQGNGIDTHRYYESLLMGAIPVVENSTLYPIFEKTTSFVLNDLFSLRLEMLQNPDPYITNMNFSREILMWETWADRINAARNGTFT
jgi:hypothetical protein